MVEFLCLTTKRKFELENPDVVVLRNGRYAFRAESPWKGKNDKTLFAFKFCRKEDYEKSLGLNEENSKSDSEESCHSQEQE